MAAAKEHTSAVKEYLDTPEPQPYVWSFPGAPIRIHLSLEVVERLTLRFRVNNGAASFGLLLGRADGLITTVSGVLPLASAEAAEIERALTKLAAASGRSSAVGFYRSQPSSQQQEGLRLNEKDMALANTFFGDSSSVILLVQPSTAGPASATFFFRDGGHLNGDFPFLEFPFDARQLASVEQRRGGAPQRGALEVLPLSPTPVHAQPRRQGIWEGVAWALLAICAGGGTAVGVRYLFERSRGSVAVPASPQPAASVPAAPQPSLGLQAERQNSDLKVTWNRESASISNATLGVISIKDGNSRRTISLQGAQVRAGSLLYTPVSDEVQMELAVATPAGNVIDSVLVLLPKAGPAQTFVVRPPQAASLPAPASPAPAWPDRPVAPESASRFQPAKPFTAPPAPPRQSAPAPPPSEPPTLAAVANSTLPAAAPLWGHPALSVQPPPVAPAPPALPVAAPNPQTQRAIAVAPVYREAETVYKAQPVFPATLLSTPTRNTITRSLAVEVLVSIDETGAVVKAEPKSQPGVHPLMVAAAVTAAKQWKFLPARRGDRPVPGEMLLRFNFARR